MKLAKLWMLVVACLFLGVMVGCGTGRGSGGGGGGGSSSGDDDDSASDDDSGPDDDAGDDDDSGANDGDCSYPEGAVEPMTLGEVLPPYAWPIAIHGDGTEVALDLENAACDTDDVLDWSPFDVLLFVSLPAW